MQVLRVHDFEVGPVHDTVPAPTPGPGEVRVTVQACGVSFFDLLIARGGYQWKPPLPFVVGSEFAGVVDTLGEGADTAFAVGDRVCGAVSIGAWTQQLCLPAAALQAVAPQASIDEAAVLNTPYGTALYGLRERGQLQPGETVLVLGAAGGVGHAAVQLARALGARVIGVDLRQFREREPDAARRLMQDVAALHRDGRIQPLITARFPFSHHADAFALAQARDTVGRVLLLPA